MWSNAWFIVSVELKRARGGLIITTLMYAYFCLFGSFITNELYDNNSVEPVSMGVSFLADILFVCSLSSIGFFLTGEYRNYWQSDIFSKRLMYMRSLPIDTKEIVLARYIQIGMSSLYSSVIFFVPFYFLSVLGERFTVVEYISFAAVWMGFGACMSIVFAYKELGGSGKSYFIYCLAWVVVYLAACGAAWYAGFGFVALAVEGVERFGLLVPFVSVTVTLAWTILWCKLTERQIRRRDYAT